MKTYLVGGAVRDKLLGLKIKDRDWVVTGATPEQMLELGYQQVGSDFPVFLHPKTHDEHALARTERKSGKGYQGFVVHASPEVTLEDDLMRRDLTINAIAEDEAGELIDPYGGIADIENRVLRHVSAAFEEDPVRIIRAARFAARFADFQFSIHDDTLQLMRSMVRSGEVDALTPERVWQEMHGALLTAQPSVFFETLRQCGALERLFPELDRLFGVPQPPKYHPEVDTGIHTWLVLDQAAQLSKETRVRFAALVHDLGKGTTPKRILPSHHGHEDRGVPLIEAFCDRFRVPNDHRQLAVQVARYHTHIHRAADLRPGTVMKVLKNTDAFRRPERFHELLLSCEADARGRTSLEDNPYPQADYYRQVLEAAQRITAKPLVEKGFKGEALGQEMDRLRIVEIKKVCKP